MRRDPRVTSVGLKVVEALAWFGPEASFLAERLQSWLDLDRRLGVPGKTTAWPARTGRALAVSPVIFQ